MSDIPSIASASAYQQALISQQIQIATLAKANDTAKAQGEAVLSLLESAVELNASMQHGASSASGIDVVA
ncbi:MAG: hypothetical protein H6816_05720 [Phycisphaerales bacterium]|nr:hypothetical protein [Phycisphaerales bacterium]